MEEFNWVEARHKCSLGELFEKLKLDVRTDVENRDKLRLSIEPEGHRYYAFRFKTSSTSFSVYVDGPPEIKNLHKSVLFALEAEGIKITIDNAPPITAIVDLNAEGRCVFRVDGVEHEHWQLRKRALDSLFFYSY